LKYLSLLSGGEFWEENRAERTRIKKKKKLVGGDYKPWDRRQFCANPPTEGIKGETKRQTKQKKKEEGPQQNPFPP